MVQTCTNKTGLHEKMYQSKKTLDGKSTNKVSNTHVATAEQSVIL